MTLCFLDITFNKNKTVTLVSKDSTSKSGLTLTKEDIEKILLEKNKVFRTKFDFNKRWFRINNVECFKTTLGTDIEEIIHLTKDDLKIYTTELKDILGILDV